jgi:hypothetical protein
MNSYARLKHEDVTVYGDLMLFRVKNRLFRPCFGISPSSFYLDLMKRLTPKWFHYEIIEDGKESRIIYNIYFYRNYESVCRSIVLPFKTVEKGSSFILHLIRVQRCLRRKLNKIREERRLVLALGLLDVIGCDCLTKVLQYC